MPFLWYSSICLVKLIFTKLLYLLHLTEYVTKSVCWEEKQTSPPTRPLVGSETVPRNVLRPNFFPEFDRNDNRDGDHGYNDDHPNPDADHNQLTDEQLRHRAT